MRISDWSSDVCSSDLEVAVDLHVVRLMLVQQAKPRIALAEIVKRQVPARLLQAAEHAERSIPVGEFLGLRDLQAESVTIDAAVVQALGNLLGNGLSGGDAAGVDIEEEPRRLRRDRCERVDRLALQQPLQRSEPAALVREVEQRADLWQHQKVAAAQQRLVARGDAGVEMHDRLERVGGFAVDRQQKALQRCERLGTPTLQTDDAGIDDPGHVGYTPASLTPAANLAENAETDPTES